MDGRAKDEFLPIDGQCPPPLDITQDASAFGHAAKLDKATDAKKHWPWHDISLGFPRS